ncbi:SdrD B-like domain-containing protein [Acinetobacter sp. ANC 3813]|uniref:SdrD B-like domain-containing protein n=1 Tax=Acinetobacter sp. ANC 3813 TaxID=1977873 RepID=UPI001D17049A|nr:SdrD B-like domain-containing protein [Acinetobacter sp. ANC 3813]
MSNNKVMNVKIDALSASAFASALLFAQQGHAAMPMAGQVIQNVAYASYEVSDLNGGQLLRTTQSNAVNIEVAKFYGLELFPDQLKQVEAGSKVVWLNQITNTSNTDAWFDFKIASINDLTNVKIYIDANKDGVYDVSDSLITNGLQLQPNQTVYLWVIADTSLQTKDQSTLELPLTAQIREEPEQQKTVLDPVAVYTPKLKIEKEVDQQRLTANHQSQRINYTLTVTNAASLPVSPAQVMVDGKKEPWVIVEDPLPANTVFEDIQSAEHDLSAVALYKIAEGQYSTAFPADKSKVDYAVMGYNKPFAAGQKSVIKLTVKTAADLSAATLVNEAYVLHNVAQNDKKTVSNKVATQVLGKATIDSTTADFQNSLYSGKVNAPVYLKSNAAMCNANRFEKEQVRVQIQSKLTGDVLVVSALESDVNSGIFQFSFDTEENAQKNLADAKLQTLKRDEVNVSLIECLDAQGQVAGSIQDVSTQVLIDPYGIVFDAKTLQPIAGATVILVDENDQPVGNNVAFEIDRSTGELKSIPAKQVTNAAGEFIYPQVIPGNYKFLIDTSTIASKHYTFASDQGLYPISSFNGMAVHSAYSYGGVFNLSAISPALNIDIPLDPMQTESGLMVKKTALDSSVELGDFTNYSIEVTNHSDILARDVKLQDTLPRGFSYVPNTMRVDGKPVSDPLGGKGPYLTLGLGDLAVNSSAKIEYRVLVGPNALNGDGINRARAVDAAGLSSNEAQAKIKVRAGVFGADAFVVGKVYADCNRNGMQDAGELGVPGVRLYMEDGSYVITDHEGKYDFYGISPKTHVLKLDRTTLPAGSELILQSNRNAGDPSSRFVDVKRSELHRADFAIADQAGECSAPLNAMIQKRQDKINQSNFNLEKAVTKQLSIDAPSFIESSIRNENTQGCLANDNDQNCLLNRETDSAASKMQLAIDPVKPPVLVNLEEYLKRSDSNALEILNLKEGQILPFAQTSIQAQGAAGATLQILVNGAAVQDKQRGKLAVLDELRKQGVEYVGVALREGKNTIQVQQLDVFGNVRESQSVNVIVPGEIKKLQLKAAQPVMANGRDILQIAIQLQDQHGVKAATRTALTLESDLGLIDLPDLNPSEPGIQTFIEGGEMIVPVIAPNVPGRGKLRVTSGLMSQEIDLQFQADLRPLVAVGLIEGAINFNQFDRNQLHSVNKNDGFETELNELADWGGNSVTGRAAMFIKGKVKGDYLLTLAYDSDKSSKQRLFRDIQPDEYYPVYGDAAAKGFEAQSTSKLYVRLDKGRSYAMYGDYMTRTEKDEGLALGQYNRSLTGIKLGHDGDKLQASAFAAQTKSRQIVTENRAMGITGPYSLGSIANDLILENSEKVEVLTRDRNNPGLIIAKQTLTRFSDYEIDSYSNSIYLKQSVASVDKDLNPNYIRITVEADEIGEEYEVGGLSFSYALKDNMKIGGSFVQSNDPLQEEQIASVNTVVKVGQHGKFIAEVAQSKNTDSTADQLTEINSQASNQNDGTAARVEFEYTPSFANVRAYHQQADAGFQNDAATISAGRKESGIKASVPVEKVGLARLEAIRTEDQNNAGIRTGLSASLERNLFKVLAVELGLRFYDETEKGATVATDGLGAYKGTTGRIKFTGKLPWKGATAFAEYEQDLSDSEKQVLSVGGTVKVLPNTELYARHELISAIDGLYSMNTTEETNSTVFGISSNYMKDGSAFSEYRVADGMSNREAEAALGLRNRWQIKPRVYVSSSFERIQTLSQKAENTGNDATAISLGLEYLAKDNWKATTRIEGRRSDSSDTLLNSIAYAYKLSEVATVLTKNTLNFIDNKDQGDHLRDRFQLGLAWRDAEQNKFDLLSKFEYYYEDNATDLESEFKRQSYVASAHVNYHPERKLMLSGQYAAKWSELDEYSISSNALTQLLSGRVIYDINEKWDFSLQTGALWANHGGGIRYLAGAELGYLLATNLWVSAGYNFLGYQDDELANTSSTGEGAYLRFRFKFDEDLFGRRAAHSNLSLESGQER